MAVHVSRDEATITEAVEAPGFEVAEQAVYKTPRTPSCVLGPWPSRRHTVQERGGLLHHPLHRLASCLRVFYSCPPWTLRVTLLCCW